MGITVQRNLLDKWIEKNGPDGVVKLALKAGVSSSLLQKVRIGKIPKRSNRILICKALNVSEATLFPTVDADEEAAS
jgi:transcriptional regulator with XRE-family HTH domain